MIHLNMQEDETVEEVHKNLQDSVWNWGQLLQATGGALKGSKCFFHLLSFRYHSDGTWYYHANNEDEEFQVGIPVTGNEAELIDHCSSGTAHKTLGVMTCPEGTNEAAIDKMKTTVMEWTDRVRAAKLSRHNFWLMADCQLRPKMFYGLGANSAGWEELDRCLMPQYYNLLPLGGIRRSVR